ncbi:MAG: hypothetical protein LBD54_02990 [Puniceicoccales bacterium]|nr:hypothetical protein [Puniceicoccales bacterium]
MAFRAYVERFCGPENLGLLEDLTAEIYGACAELYYPEEQKIIQLAEHFMWVHIRYCRSQLPPECREAFDADWSQRNIRCQDHSEKFPPQITAVFNLSQAVKALCAFLRTNPLPELHSRVMNFDEDENRLKDTRAKVSEYRTLLGEVIAHLGDLDEALCDALNPLRPSPAQQGQAAPPAIAPAGPPPQARQPIPVFMED